MDKLRSIYQTDMRALALALLIPLVVGCAGSTGQQSTPTPMVFPATATLGTSTSSTELTPPPAISSSADAFRTVIRQVSEEVKPAVVQITNEQQVRAGYSSGQSLTIPAGVGSGIIYSPDGYIITNNHVIEGAQRLLVSLPDGRSFQAKLIGGDSQTDLAAVKIDASGLPVAKLGDSNQLQVGDWVVAIGNALALPGGPTVTAGVVSALGRTGQEPGITGMGQGPFLFDVIQTDAPINPGNSGGPLVNLDGQVIGINTLVAGQAQGIGFAIAVATAKPIADQLVATGSVVHPYMGINYIPLNPAVAFQLGAQQTKGIVVANVATGSPADRAHLQRGDVITEVDGTPVVDDSDMARIIHNQKPGDNLTLTVERDGRTLTVKLTLGEAPTS